MVENKKTLSILKVAMIFIIATLLFAGIIFFSSPIQIESTKASGDLFVTIGRRIGDDTFIGIEEYEYSLWFDGVNADKPKITKVVYYTNDGNQDVPNPVSTYTWKLTNIENSAYTYSGNQTQPLVPLVAGNYTLRVTASSRFYDSDGETIKYKARVLINKSVSNVFEAVYDGSNFRDFYDWNKLKNYFSITNADGMPGNISDYQLAIEWGTYVEDVIDADTYMFKLNLVKKVGSTTTTYDYISYGNASNESTFKINKRPILLDKDVVFAQKEKMYNGNPLADGYLYENGEGDDRYGYLKTSTNFGNNTGFLLSDYNSIKNDLINEEDIQTLLIFKDIANGDAFVNSYFMDAQGNSSSSVSQSGPDGEIVYDKKIQLYYAINPYFSSIKRNYAIARNTGTEIAPIYTTYSNYASYVEPEARIIPGFVVLSVNQTQKEYGTLLEDLLYEITVDASTVPPNKIPAVYSGDMFSETIKFASDGSSSIRINIKVGRRCEEYELDEFDFIGRDIDGNELLLIETKNYTPLVGIFFFYVEVFYNGTPMVATQADEAYSCGPVNLRFVINSLEIAPKQLTIPAGLIVSSEKEYDGLLQADSNFSSEAFNSQLIIFKEYNNNHQLVPDADSQYIEILIKPVYESPNAGIDKIINVSFILRLTPLGVSHNKQRLLTSYLVPQSYIIEECKINKKEILYTFDMTNSVERPISNDFLFPNEEILMFEKAYNAPMPIIKELLFGDYVTDGYGNIVYEDVYKRRAKTFINEQGLVQDETDFYGNVVYETYGSPTSMPKRKNFLIGNDDPYDVARTPSGFDWEDAIDFSYYCLEELYPAGHDLEGIQKSIQVSRYESNGSGGYNVYIIDQTTPGAVLRTVQQNTPPSGNPGILIKIKQFSSDNYVYNPKLINNEAYLNITKKNPEWSVSENQTETYNGRQHSNMLEDISGDMQINAPLVEPFRSQFGTDAEYQIALANYNYKVSTYFEFIKINLSGHGEFLEIIGEGGKGININVLQYAPIGQGTLYNVDTYDYESVIREIKIAGRYKIAISLPETATYRASEEVIVFLTIEQVELKVYLSISERHYDEPNVPSEPLTLKTEATDLTEWGWSLDHNEINSYRNTLFYSGFVNGEDPNNIGFGSFVHPYVDYGLVDRDSQPGSYSISALGGSAHNYSFNCLSSFSTLIILELKAEIILVKDEINVIYDASIESWRVNEYVDGEDDPLAAYIYNVDDLSEVDVTVVGFKPMEEEYDFSLHYIYLRNALNKLVLDEFGNPIIIEFSPKIIKVDGEWVPYDEDLTGEILDCSPPENFRKAKLVGQYILRLSANANFYQNPDPKFVFFNIGYAETTVEITEGTIVHPYDGSWFHINGVGSNEEDYNFITNNKEIQVYIRVEYSQEDFDAVGATFVEILAKTPYTDFIDTKIKNAGFYKVYFIFEHNEGELRNYTLPNPNEYLLKVQVIKGEVVLTFDEGEQEWFYRGTPYEVLDNATLESGVLGVVYFVTPMVPYSSIIIEIYKYVYINGNPLPLDQGMRVSEAVDVGLYLFRMKASGASTENYDDSEWVEKEFEIRKATINVYIQGKLIDAGGNERYPLEKIYGEDNPEENLEIYYTGWANGEDPEHENPDKIPAGFSPATINWNEVTKTQNARPNTPYSLIPNGASSENYAFKYNSVSFYILRKAGEVLINEEYTTAVYTGVDQQLSSTFRSRTAPVEGIDSPFAFSLNYDPLLTSFTIELVGRKTLNEIDTTVSQCIDVGEYIFSIAASQSENYTAIPPTEYSFYVSKAELKAYIADVEIIYGEQYPIFTLSYIGYVGKDVSSIAPIYHLDNSGECLRISGTERVQNLKNPVLVIPSNAIDYKSGGYTIHLAGGSSTNYWINVEDTANLNIKKKDLTIISAETIIKQYDGTNFANNFVSKNNYAFVGAIRHYLKQYDKVDDVDTIGLSFQARFDSFEVGRRTVKMQELRINNNNYNLLTVEFVCNGQIIKLEPQISYSNRPFTYDGTQKQVIPVVTGLPGDEVNYIVKYRGTNSTTYMESLSPPTIAGSYEAIVTTNDSNYSDKNYTIDMVINKARVNILFGGDIMQIYGNVTGLSARAMGIAGYEQNIVVKYYDMEENLIDNISQSNQGRYKAVAVYDATANYLSTKSEEEIWIRPKTVPVSIYSSTSSYVYDGQMKHQRAEFYNILGVLEQTYISYAQIENGIEKFINLDGVGKVIPSIAPKNVGVYKIYAIAPSENYVLEGDLSASFEITTRQLNIRVNDLVIKSGEMPSFTYKVQGIATTDSINSLKKKPTIQYFDENTQTFAELSTLNNGIAPVGMYRIIPNGAEDNNYDITYTEGRMTVNAVQLVANTTYSSGLYLEGSFSPGANLSVKVVQTGGYSKASTAFEVFKMNNGDFKDTSLSEIYDISIIQGNVMEGNLITVRLMLDAGLRGEDVYSIAHMKSDGSIEIIEASEIDGEYLVFNVSELGNFSILVDSQNKTSEIWVYVAIAGAILIILLGVVIIKKRA